MAYMASASGLSESSNVYGASPTVTVHIPIKIRNEIIVDDMVAIATDFPVGGLASWATVATESKPR